MSGRKRRKTPRHPGEMEEPTRSTRDAPRQYRGVMLGALRSMRAIPLTGQRLRRDGRPVSRQGKRDCARAVMPSSDAFALGGAKMSGQLPRALSAAADSSGISTEACRRPEMFPSVLMAHLLGGMCSAGSGGAVSGSALRLGMPPAGGSRSGNCPRPPVREADGLARHHGGCRCWQIRRPRGRGLGFDVTRGGHRTTRSRG